MSQKYAIQSKDEATAYMNHELLGKRLLEITKALIKVEDKSAYDIFGSPDDLKLRSSMTLFSKVTSDEILTKVLQQYFIGAICEKTAQILSKL